MTQRRDTDMLSLKSNIGCVCPESVNFCRLSKMKGALGGPVQGYMYGLSRRNWSCGIPGGAERHDG